MEHRRQPPGKVGPRGHLVRDTRVADLPLGADDALCDRRRPGQEGPGDLLGREIADLAQGERDLCVGRQRRMAAGEDQPQAVVREGVLVTSMLPMRAPGILEAT